MIPQSTINMCVKAYYGSNEDTDYGKIQAVLLVYEATRPAESVAQGSYRFEVDTIGRISFFHNDRCIFPLIDTGAGKSGISDGDGVAIFDYVMTEEQISELAKAAGFESPTPATGSGGEAVHGGRPMTMREIMDAEDATHPAPAGGDAPTLTAKPGAEGVK